MARARIVHLEDGARTTVHVATFPLASTELRVIVLAPPRTLPEWCRASGIEHALVGGFYTRATGTPLGELRTHGIRRHSEPFTHPGRSCLSVVGGVPTIAPRSELAARPRGDLLQAGPMLVRHGRPLVAGDDDPEGFSAGHEQFDSDITHGRHPRAALGLGEGVAIAVAVDGRSDEDAGLTLAELAQLMAGLGAATAINLDGGGSTSLVSDGKLVNRPRDNHGALPHSGRRIVTAVAFAPNCENGTGYSPVPDDLAASSW